MDERQRFVARLLEGDKMATLCREFGIFRKAAYKLYRCYRDIGPQGLTDRSRRRCRQANKPPIQLESRIVPLRREHPTWRAPRIRETLCRLQLGVQTPAIGIDLDDVTVPASLAVRLDCPLLWPPGPHRQGVGSPEMACLEKGWNPVLRPHTRANENFHDYTARTRNNCFIWREPCAQLTAAW
jgi:hypothetical protein